MGNHETTPKQSCLSIEQKGLRERVSETERERERKGEFIYSINDEGAL